MTEPVIASMTLVLLCRDEHGTIIHSEEVQQVQESQPGALEELEQENRLLRARNERLVARIERAEELLARCENEMRYAGWTRFESDNPQRNGLYEQVKGFL